MSWRGPTFGVCRFRRLGGRKEEKWGLATDLERAGYGKVGISRRGEGVGWTDRSARASWPVCSVLGLKGNFG